MTGAAPRSSAWIPQVVAGLLYGAAILRAALTYRSGPAFGQALALLAASLALFLSQPALTRRWSPYLHLYLGLQSLLALALLLLPDPSDYFAVVFAVLSMQAMLRLDLRPGALWIGLFTLIMAFPLARTYGVFRGLAFALLYTALDVFVGAYALATRRAQSAQAHNRALVQELSEANRALQDYTARLEQLAAARERQRLARELHDSVTQTLFSMTLATQSALILAERDPGRVGAQLDRLSQLAQGALAEMRLLISELRPARLAEGGLGQALRRHVAERGLPEDLRVTVEVEGDAPLGRVEEQGLFRIAQEALNNVVKHAQAPRACIRLHLAEPCWMEIEDWGRGFAARPAGNGGGVGLAGMAERADEIGWALSIASTPGAGTRVRVEKRPAAGGEP